MGGAARRLGKLDRRLGALTGRRPTRPPGPHSRALLAAAIDWANPDAVEQFAADVAAVVQVEPCYPRYDQSWANWHRAKIAANRAARMLDVVLRRPGESEEDWAARVADTGASPYAAAWPPPRAHGMAPDVLDRLTDRVSVERVRAALADLKPPEELIPEGIRDDPDAVAEYVGIVSRVVDAIERRAAEEDATGIIRNDHDPEEQELAELLYEAHRKAAAKAAAKAEGPAVCL